MKLRIKMVDFWGTPEMDRSLSLRGNNEDKIYPASITGPKGVAGHSGSVGVSGPVGISGSGQHTHGYQTYKVSRRNGLSYHTCIPEQLDTGMIFDIPEVIYTMDSDVQFHFDLEYSDYKDHNLVLYVVQNDVNVLFESHRFHEAVSSLSYVESWRSVSKFFDYTKTDVKADSTVPELYKKETYDVDSIEKMLHGSMVYANSTITSHVNAQDLLVPNDDIYRQMILDDVEKYVVQSLSTTLSNLPAETEVIERFPQIPFEYWKLLFHIHNSSYTRNLVKEHISHKYRALCTIAQYMEDSYASTIRDIPRL